MSFITRKHYYPWTLYRKVFLNTFLLLNGLFILSLAIASYIFDFSFYTEKPFIFIFIFAALSAAGSAWYAYVFVSPLKRIILKALRIANRKQFADYPEEESDLFDEEPGEYFDLEYALDKIKNKMSRRKSQLAHEREESQALMGSLVEAIVSVDHEFKLTSYNTRFATLFLSSELAKSGIENLHLMQIFREPKIHELFDKALKLGEINSVRLQIATAATSGRSFSLTVSPLYEDLQKTAIYGALASFHDITDLLMAEKIRVEFVENASHELRTPLTSVKGFLETAKEDLQSKNYDQLSSFLSIISRNVDRLIELVNDMLTISSLESQSEMKAETIDPQPLTEMVIEQLTPLAKEKNISIHLSCELDRMKMDCGKVEQVLNNLIANAIKYSRSHDQIFVSWKKTDQGIELSVKDTGPGIAAEHLPRLFERFYRIDKARSRDQGGTGLGLAIVKHIMQSHGGTVRVRSEFGQGAEFICLFP